jgi:hypothetical protein
MMHSALTKMKGPITTGKEKAVAEKIEKVRKLHTKTSKFGAIRIPPHPSVAVAKALKSLIHQPLV